MFDFETFIHKNIKVILLVSFVLLIILIVVFSIFQYEKKSVLDKEMTKRILFCDGKTGKVPYDFICHKSGECEQQYLWCDYLNYLRENNIVETGKYNYQKINQAYSEKFNNDTTTN